MTVVSETEMGWRYPASESRRDLRIDFLRGVAMLMVVIAHIEIPSAYHLFTPERIGVVSEPEVFVFLSGLVIGLIYPALIAKEGWRSAAQKLFKRSLQLYIVSLWVVILVYLLRFVPAINASVLYTWTDSQTGIVYDLYNNPGADAGNFIQNMLVLRYGPGQFNIMGLFVILMFIAPVILWALYHKQTLLLLVISGGFYIFNVIQPTRVTIAQFENAFSLLAWQLLFVIGVAAGFHWDKLLRIIQGKYGRPILIICAVLFFILLVYSLNNPWTVIPYDLRLTIIDADTFTEIYSGWFSRVRLGIGRVINTLLAFIFFYMLLTRFWKGFNKAFGWFFIPIGQASLYVFIVHLFYVVLMDNIPIFRENRVWVNAAGETLVLLAIWLMVRRRFLFKIIPR